MKKYINILSFAIVGLNLFWQTFLVGSVGAVCDNQTDSNSCIVLSPLPKVANTVASQSNTVAVVLNLTFVILGSVAVLIMVLAGFRYITSSGKPEELAKAKDTIIYAAVGIIVCIMAVTIVSFVAGLIK